MKKIIEQLEPSWKTAINEEFTKPYFIQLQNFVADEREKHSVYPDEHLVFNALNQTPFDAVSVVILGQDPYHGEGQAHGLSFSVPSGIKPPPSLVNIFKELHSDLGSKTTKNGNLESWAKQGVLLLNATLTVRANEAGSHQRQGWEDFTNAIIRAISIHKKGIIFLLWGKYAQAKTELIDDSKHFILKAAHPSPLSAYNGFWGCKHFSQTNQLLQQQGKPTINWSID